MELLLDTHVFIWWEMRSDRLGSEARRLIADPGNRAFVSAVAIWEIAIKRRSGKLRFEGPLVAAVRAAGFDALAISAEDCETAGGLDWAHADPFDRLIVAQASRRALTVVTANRVVRDFPGVASISAT